MEMNSQCQSRGAGPLMSVLNFLERAFTLIRKMILFYPGKCDLGFSEDASAQVHLYVH